MTGLPFVDVTGKKVLTCENCGFENPIPPREISMKSLRHMQTVQWFTKWRKKKTPSTSSSYGLGNVRLLVCLSCGQPHICKDQFSADTR